MSLLNRVLADLEKRRFHADPPAVPALGKGGTPPPRRWLVIATRVILAGVLLFLIWDNWVANYFFPRPAAPPQVFVAPVIKVPQIGKAGPPPPAAAPAAGGAPPPAAARPTATRLTEVRLAEEPERVRLMLRLTKATSYSVQRLAEGKGIAVSLRDTLLAATLPPPEAAHRPLTELQAVSRDNDLDLQLTLAQATESRQFLTPPGADGRVTLVVDLLRSAAAPETVPEPPPAAPSVAPGDRAEGAAGGSAELTKVARDRKAAERPDRADELFRKGWELIESGDVTGGEEELREALRVNRGAAKPRETLAALLIREGRVSEAGALLAEGLHLNPRSPALAQLYARILVDQGDNDYALTVLEGARAKAENDPDYLAFVAAVQQRLGNHQEAAALYRRVLDLRPTQASWWLGLGVSLEALGQRRLAAEAYGRARLGARFTPAVEQFLEQRLAALGERK